jgi:eukaryotic-like serine/threonine-protein kinase
MSDPVLPTTISDTTVPVKSVAFPSCGETITSDRSGISYIIGEQIGEGHFGVVYQCTDSWGNELAAKILKPLGTYDEVREKAEAEFVKLVAVRCPYITFVYDAFEFRDTFYLITERCHNTVERLLQLDNFAGRLWILPIARCLLQALHYMHVSGLVHQDIHLGNVFVSFTKDEMTGHANQSMHFKVADLGVAKLMAEVDATNTRAQWMLPPEVLDPTEFGPIGHQVDIYHAALLLLQVALGSPVQFTQQEMLEGKPREIALGLEPPLNFALEKALRRHVLYRTANAMEFWRDLNSPPSHPGDRGEGHEAATS